MERTSHMTLWLNLLASLRKREMLQINQEVVQDVRPPMKTQQLRYLQRLYRVPEKASDGCLQKVVSADRVSGAF